MKKVLKNLKTILVSYFLLFLIGCAGHPTISPNPLKKGESYTAFNYSVESGVPSYVYRRGITNLTDVGIRIGLPFYGSGVDFSRLLIQNGVLVYFFKSLAIFPSLSEYSENT